MSRRPTARSRSWQLGSLAFAAATLLFLSSAEADCQTLDLTSLAFTADAIVLAERLSADSYGADSPTQFRVSKVYSGELSVGDIVDLACRDYRIRYRDERINRRDPRRVLPQRSLPGPDVVLFLQHGTLGTPGWHLVPSGMRVQIEGRVFRFQWDFFDGDGSYLPLPQGRDPLDLYGVYGEDEPVTLEDFERQLGAAMGRAERARETIENPRNVRELIDLMGPDCDGAGPTNGGTVCLRNTVGAAALHKLAESADLGAVLEGCAKQGYGDKLVDKFGVEVLRRYALDRGEPPDRRRAALALVWSSGASFFASKRRMHGKQELSLALLDDPDGSVRASAVHQLYAYDADSTVRDALVARWLVETDPAVLYEIYRRAQRGSHNGFRERLAADGKDYPLVEAERCGSIITIHRFNPDAQSWRLARASIAVKADGRPPLLLQLSNGKAGGLLSSNGDESFTFALRPGALPRGTYTLDLDLRFIGDGLEKTRTFQLHPMSVADPGVLLDPLPGTVLPDLPATLGAPLSKVFEGGQGCNAGGGAPWRGVGSPAVVVMLGWACAGLRRWRSLKRGAVERHPGLEVR